MVEKQKTPETRARKAEALRANLRKRKAAARKAKDAGTKTPPERDAK